MNSSQVSTNNRLRRVGIASFCVLLCGVSLFAQQSQQTGTPYPQPAQAGSYPDQNPPPASAQGGYGPGGYGPGGYGQAQGNQGYRPMPGAQQGQMQGPIQPQAMPTGDLTLPAGTLLSVRVNQVLSSDRNQPGDGFSASIQQPLVVNGFVVAARGQSVIGRVTMTEKAGRVKGTSKLGIELGELSIVDGQQMPIRTELVEQRGDTSFGRDAAGIATTTGLGAAIGGSVNGGVGAGVGAAAGMVAGIAGVMLTRGHETVIYPETMLTFRLTAPVTVQTSRSAAAFQPVAQQDYQNNQPVMTRYGQGSGYGSYGAYGPARVYRPYPYYDFYPGYGYGYGYAYGPSFFFSSSRYGHYRGYRFR